MEDRLREIEGTLARTSERKNTILYKLAKRKAQEERLAQLGIKKVPTNPRTVTDPQVAKYALAQLKQELGDKIAKIRNESLVNLERDGEAVVRAKNDEINKLLIQRDQWERRIADLTGKEWQSQRSRKKVYFGCAKQLPEAQPADASDRRVAKRQRDGEEDGEADSFEDDTEEFISETDSESSADSPAENGGFGSSTHPSSSTVNTGYLAAVSTVTTSVDEPQILEEEKRAERLFREKNPFDAAFLGQFRQATAADQSDTYLFRLRELVIPDEGELLKQAVQQRKEALQKKLAALREGK